MASRRVNRIEKMTLGRRLPVDDLESIFSAPHSK